MNANKNLPKIYSDWLRVKKDMVPKFPLSDQCLDMQLQTTFSLLDLIAWATANRSLYIFGIKVLAYISTHLSIYIMCSGVLLM
jgi:hypothetical protein